MTAVSARPVPWVPPVLYAAVLLGGLYYDLVSEQPVRPLRVVGFVGALVLLSILEVLEWRRFPTHTPAGTAVTLLIARLLLFVGVAALDGSGVSRALFVLLPFSAYFAFGRTVSLALGAVCVALLGFAFSVTVPRWYLTAEYVSDLLMFALGLLLAICMAAVAVDERRGRARVVELSAAAERLRLARDIHDSLGHHLTAAAVQLRTAAAFLDLDRAAAEQALADAQWSTERALHDVRQSVAELRAEPAPFRLAAALAELADHATDDAFTVTVRVTGNEGAHDVEVLTALYRAMQEGLTNARRHGHATQVTVTVDLDPGGARLVVTDNGRGFVADRGSATTAAERDGFGLRGMRERVQLVGGRLDIDSTPGSGSTLTVTVPRKLLSVR